MQNFSIGFSPCPNDTFIFDALVHNKIEVGDLSFTPHIYDVEKLNQMAFDCLLDITKLSFYALLKLEDKYTILDSGAALGFGCGPLLVSTNKNIDLTQAKIAVPGAHTTANLLLKLWMPEAKNTINTGFEKILPGIQNGTFDAGVIIHEGRFVYESFNCEKIIDLGKWWEDFTGHPIPLGCIAIKNTAEIIEYKEHVEKLIHDSIKFAHENKNEPMDFIKANAQELDEAVIAGHIDLYVNDFSLSLGQKGMKAVAKLREMAKCRNIL